MTCKLHHVLHNKYICYICNYICGFDCVIFLFVYATDTSYICHKDGRSEHLAEIQRVEKPKPGNARARFNNLEGTSDIRRNSSIH